MQRSPIAILLAIACLLPGCEAEPTGGDGGTGGTGGTTSSTSKGSTTASGFSGSSTSTGVIIDDPSDCEHPSQFDCSRCPDCGCRCNPERPASPASCLSTTDFHCASYMPEYVTCECDPTAPDKPADCGIPFTFVCAAENPPVGCLCVPPKP